MWTPYKKITPSDRSVIRRTIKIRLGRWVDDLSAPSENNPHTAQRACETPPGMCACVRENIMAVNACEPRFYDMRCYNTLYLPCIKPPFVPVLLCSRNEAVLISSISSLSFITLSQTPCIHYRSLNRRKNDGLF